MKYTYIPKGVCSKKLQIDLDEKTHIINEVTFMGGCAGNTFGISKLVKGMKAEDVINILKGTPCGYKSTSCPDQLAIALENMLNNI